MTELGLRVAHVAGVSENQEHVFRKQRVLGDCLFILVLTVLDQPEFDEDRQGGAYLEGKGEIRGGLESAGEIYLCPG